MASEGPRKQLAPNGLCTVTIWLNAFVDPDAVDPPWITTINNPAYMGRSALLRDADNPTLGSPDRFLTDGRGFSNDIFAQARMHAEIQFRAQMQAPGPVDPDPPTLIARTSFTDQTIGFDRNLGHAPPDDEVVCEANATMAMPWQPAPLDDWTRVFDLYAATSNPCVDDPWLIEASGTLFVSNMGDHVEVGFLGLVDEFPSFEMYATDGTRVITMFREDNQGGTPLGMHGNPDGIVGGWSNQLCRAL